MNKILKYTVFLFLGIFLILVGSFINNLTSISNPNEKVALFNEELDQNNLFFNMSNSIIYFNCDPSKKNVINNCKLTEDKNKCLREIATIDFLYLYKSNATIDKYTDVKDLMSDWIKIEKNPQFTEKELNSEIDNFVQGKTNIFPFADEFNLIKGGNDLEILNKYQSDKNLLNFYNNVISFRNTKTIDDCENIKIYNYTNEYNSILKNTCNFYFKEDKISYCRDFLNKEIIANRYN